MLDEGLFSFNQLSYIPNANYGGYLVGSIFFTFGSNWDYIFCSSHTILCSYSNECT
ncbi:MULTISPECIES: YbfB/YjiJ family MFS transporter [unclassified Bartonella]|uniref:YbfB/YjiJ family MFS transporter n=1 Tax=unclassified Bartonella TaxID=2645622 RepID=UPI0035CFB720